MEGTIKVLYLSYDGMTDPLGQSQVLPYIKGLTRKGCNIHLISFEKSDRFIQGRDEILEFCKANGITWHPMSYTKRPPILSTLWDIWRMGKMAKKLFASQKFHIIHARSYISAFIALRMKRKLGVRFLFDMRGFYPDERVDGGIWRMERFPYAHIYRFFKRAEIKFLSHSDHIISLTHSGKQILADYPSLLRDMEKSVTVIPCCVDTDLFNPIASASPTLSGEEKRLCYVGSLGTWYLVEDMVRFVAALYKHDSTWRWLVITRDSDSELLNFVDKHQLPLHVLQIRSATRNELPNILASCHASIFFIKPTFSKQASSPTKQGEVMAMGLPVICNAGVGDSDAIVNEWEAGLVLPDLTDSSLEQGAEDWLRLYNSYSSEKIRSGALEVFSLTKGVEKYYSVYLDMVRDL